MQKKIISFLLLLVSFITILPNANAAFAQDPLSRPNNFFGIHILFPSELDQAKNLVNSKGGDWGYVTIPIQMYDRDMEKWQQFMDKAKELHVIPLVRLATQNHPLNTSVWRKPTYSDVLDFANFLSSIRWPTENKYVILFNEVNRFDEWAGEYPSPQEYADIVSYAYEIFKERDPNFFMILGGMDAAAPNDYTKYISGLDYLTQLVNTTNIEDKIDGFSSHSYPNPAFSAYPSENKKVGVATYRFEYELLNKSAPKKLPVFITETGWSNKSLPDSIIAKYYDMTISQIWNKDKDKIVAITPFLLNATGEPFDQFSFFKNGTEADFSKLIGSLQKTKGSPLLSSSLKVVSEAKTKTLSVAKFEITGEKEKKLTISPLVTMYFKTIFGIN
jgi:hypothetical protein